ncbi:MAG: [FeFe] hydrogenase H-cluster radical SAM maturase HydE [Proteiniphilum sp.]
MSEHIGQKEWTKEKLTAWLDVTGTEEEQLFRHSAAVKQEYVGNSVYLRGLIELSNICEKDCYYCGIRRSNCKVHRYTVSHDEVLAAVRFAYEKGFGSVTIQSGEMTSPAFIRRIDRILREAKKITQGEIGITLSCGEQTEETYRRWFESGAERYLLRIETSSEALYRKLHPDDAKHSYARRVEALEALRKTGYQTGTGVMIGLPFQTAEDLADDLLFMKQREIDMCGMGPYIAHADTPLWAFRDQLLPLGARLRLSLRMVSLLRILMPDINIAATTALQAIATEGREEAICIGANVLMPNITPAQYRDDYLLYENKPVFTRNDEDELAYLEAQLQKINHHIGYYRKGNSPHYRKSDRVQTAEHHRQ